MALRLEPGEDGARRARVRAGIVALVAGSAIFAAKLFAWRLTGSTAVLSDAAESIVNVMAGALLLVSLVVAARPADENHPYGHGKVEFFSAGFEGACIAIAALAIVVEAVRAIVRGPELRNLDTGLVVLVASAAANGLLGLHLVRVGRRHQSVALVADGRHVLTDVTTSVAVLGGLVAVRVTGIVMLDPVIAILAALNILWTGWGLVRGAVGALMDEAEPARLAGIVAWLEEARTPDWIGVHSLRAWRSGHVQHVDFHLIVPRYLDAEALHAMEATVEAGLARASGLPTEAFVHFDPCRPESCAGCAKDPCPIREAPLVRRESIVAATAIGPGPQQRMAP